MASTSAATRPAYAHAGVSRGRHTVAQAHSDTKSHKHVWAATQRARPTTTKHITLMRGLGGPVRVLSIARSRSAALTHKPLPTTRHAAYLRMHPIRASSASSDSEVDAATEVVEEKSQNGASPAESQNTRQGRPDGTFTKNRRIVGPGPKIGLFQKEQEELGLADKPEEPEEPEGRVVKKPKTESSKDMMAYLKDKLVMLGLLAIWYSSNIFYNIFNKQVMQTFAFPTTCTLIHLVTATCLMSLMWLLRIKKSPTVSKRLVTEVAPLSVLHLVGFLMTNLSLGAVNVSLTHTIKSMEPFFTVVLSYFFLGSVPSLPVMITLLPIVAGVVVASATDLSFNWYGFVTAMGSNLAFQSRNVISKKYMVESSLESQESGGSESHDPLDEINLFACITVAATVLMIPVMLAIDGANLLARAQLLGPAQVISNDALMKTCIAGVCRTGDVLASYALLSRLNPVTHSVSNCVKRVVVIVVSLVFFKTPVTMLNIVGTTLALSGVFAYSMAKRMTVDPDLSNSLKSKSPLSFEKMVLMFIPNFVLDYLVNLKQTSDLKAKEAKARDNGPEPEYKL